MTASAEEGRRALAQKCCSAATRGASQAPRRRGPASGVTSSGYLLRSPQPVGRLAPITGSPLLTQPRAKDPIGHAPP